MAPARAAAAAAAKSAAAPPATVPDGFRIGAIEPRHRAEWEALYIGYAEFYQTPQNAEMRARVWTWLHDPAHELEGLVCESTHGHAVGLIHFRRFVRPLSAATGGFIDDLYVDQVHRGRGLGAALIGAAAEIGRKRGWTLLRWITAENNYRARTLYDEVGARTDWLTYDIKL